MIQFFFLQYRTRFILEKTNVFFINRDEWIVIRYGKKPTSLSKFGRVARRVMVVMENDESRIKNRQKKNRKAAANWDSSTFIFVLNSIRSRPQEYTLISRRCTVGLDSAITEEAKRHYKCFSQSYQLYYGDHIQQPFASICPHSAYLLKISIRVVHLGNIFLRLTRCKLAL